MEKTDNEADDAIAYIRQRTAAPIERFLDSVVAARLEEDRSLHDSNTVSPSELGPCRVAEGFGRSVKDLVPFLREALSVQPFVRIVHRIRQRRSRNES